MFVQCRVCKRIRVDGKYRLPWPGELSSEVAETYCPTCAQETLEQIRRGAFNALEAGSPAAGRREVAM